ncbi:hypothetical protein AB0O28_33780 [Microbispora sp. NPDC088329]|uniref:hypothetical protein n=1 Tax=Microbispora sp. NPDC088329 TaxID=3154869 RepID=UPI003430AD91
MARMIRAIDDEVYVEDDAFGLYDTDVSIDSAGSDHWAAVRLEAWDGEPPPADESWETADRLTFEAETGIVALVMPEGTGHDFLIGPPYFEYAVAVYSKGGGDLEEAQERWYEAFEEGVEEPVRGVERWLLRFSGPFVMSSTPSGTCGRFRTANRGGWSRSPGRPSPSRCRCPCRRRRSGRPRSRTRCGPLSRSGCGARRRCS